MDAESVRLRFKGAIRARIRIDDAVLMMDVVHPSYSVPDAEKIRTLEPLISKREPPYILTGDFNTVHPDDAYEWAALSEELMAFNAEKAHHTVENWKRAECVRWILQLGLQDAFPASRRASTVPTNYVSGGPKSGVRMDFFFTSSNVEVLDSYVLKTPDTEMASDHYPIVGIFSVQR